MKIKLDKADVVFSQYIRQRDGRCVRCGGTENLQNSHYFGRGRETTRFDPENCDALCFGCHRFWGSDNREDYRNFKINQLGEDGFKALTVRANLIGKKDRKLAYIVSKALLDELKMTT